MTAALVSAFHILGIVLSTKSIAMRSRSLMGDPPDLPRALLGDNLWGISALIVIATGAWRAFGGLEKGTPFYLQNPAFHAKMTLLGLVFLLELWPMTTFIKWRVQLNRGETPDTSRAMTFARIGRVQALLLVAMIFAGAFMARGIGMA